MKKKNQHKKLNYYKHAMLGAGKCLQSKKYYLISLIFAYMNRLKGNTIQYFVFIWECFDVHTTHRMRSISYFPSCL